VSRLAAEAEEMRRRSISRLNVASKRPPPGAGATDVTHRVILAGAMAPYAWSLNGEYWPEVTALTIATGQRVAIEMVNHSMMAHPMHLHGHAFQVMALNGMPARRCGARYRPGATTHPDCLPPAFHLAAFGRLGVSLCVVSVREYIRAYDEEGFSTADETTAAGPRFS
jgi:FtsP/CotA-like multicopper oxidase with cupredoxin domain